ncbi:hypothetical protein SLA2020_386850 [Shorea laevis]
MVCTFQDTSREGCLEVCRREWDRFGGDTTRSSNGSISQPAVNFSVEFILDIVNGRERVPFTRFVDVREVTFAHILVFEVPSASRRYCMVERTADYFVVLKILDDLYPDLHLNGKHKGKAVGTLYKISKEKAISLGVDFIPQEVRVKDTVENLKEKDFLSI